MLPLFSYETIRYTTHQREINKSIIENKQKRNTTIDNSVKKVMDITIRFCIATILFSNHKGLGWITRSGLRYAFNKAKALDG